MFRPLIRAALPVALGAAFLACNESTAPSAQDSTLTVQVYVDRNGDGVFDPTDLPVDGAQIQALPTGGTAVDLTTGADGTATVGDVPPGTYTLSLISGAPEGTTLTTATNPVVVAEYFGGDLSAEFRFAFEPGGIAGVVYRDDDESGDFDPEFDTPGPGIPVSVQVTATEEVMGETSTDEDGAYLFTGLRPGNYTVKFFPPETAEIVGGDRAVTVVADELADGTVQFTGSLLVDIAEARATDEGKTVTVEGVVTWAPSFSTATYYIQDETGGVGTFDSNNPELTEGDRIQITGTVGSFRGELQLSPVTLLVPVGTEDVPAPRPVTAAEINAGDYQGELIVIDGTVQAVEVLSFGNQRVTLTDGAAEEFFVYADSRTGVEEAAWVVGESYTVSGILTTDDRDAEPERIEVRGPQDVVLGGSVITIAEARGMDGETVVVEGVVSWQIPWSGGNLYFYEDETGGILSFHNSESTEIPTLSRGDRIRVGGTVSSFRSEVQISPVQSVQILSSGPPLVPKVVGADDINAGLHQGELVKVAGTVSTVDTLSFDNQAVIILEGIDSLAVYVDSRNGVLPGIWVAGDPYFVTGVLGTDDRQDLPYRVEPRDSADIENVASENIIEISSARGMDGDTVTVIGQITWQVPWQPEVYFFEDGTGGLSTFHSGAPTLNEGDAVKVRGSIGAFRGEVQISPLETEVLAVGLPLDPTEVTGAEINAGQYQGQLVRLVAELVSVDTLSFDNQAVTLKDGSGTEFSVYGDSRTGVLPANWPGVGGIIQVTGVLGTDDRNTPAARLEVRRPSDIAEPPLEITPLGVARGLDGDTVNVEGVITWQTSWDDRSFFLQDESGGISAFYTDAPDMNEGDRVLISGSIGSFRSEIQISPLTLEVTGTGPVPDPVPVTGAQINAGERQGQLVSIDAVLLSVDTLSFDNQAVTLEDGSGTQFSVYSDSRTGILPGAWPDSGQAVSLVGILGYDDRNDPAARLEPRGTGDVVVAPEPELKTIAEARALVGDPTEIEIQGVITWQAGWDDRNFFLQDATGGLSSFYFDAPTMAEGDRVSILGTISAFRGEVQVSPTSLEITSSGAPVTPLPITGAQINAGERQGELVTIRGAVVAVDTTNSFQNQIVTLRDGVGTEFLVFADARTGLALGDWPAVDAEVDVTGVLGYDDRLLADGQGGTEGPRLEPRRPEDVAPVPAPVVAGGDR